MTTIPVSTLPLGLTRVHVPIPITGVPKRRAMATSERVPYPPATAITEAAERMTKAIAGFTEARWNDDVHPGVGRGGIKTWKNPHRCATRRLGSAASCTHDPHKATTDHDGAELSKGGANLLGDHFDRGWCVARSDDGDLDGHN